MFSQKSKFLGFITVVLVIAALTFAAGCAAQKEAPTSAPKAEAPAQPTLERPEVVTSPAEAKQLLLDGNDRFVKGKLAKKDLGNERRQKIFTEGQKPFAVIVSCSDSRVPPELIFDQGLGDLFVIRVAGNVLDKIATGSVEYGVEHVHCPLVVVLGHQDCGAVKATIKGGKAASENLGAIVAKINPSVEKAKAAGATDTALVEKTAEENVLAMVAELEKNHIIKELAESGKVAVVGAKYHLDTGKVEWYETSKEH